MALSGTYVYFHALFDTFSHISGTHNSHGCLWFSEVIEDGTYLASGEILAVSVIASGFQLLLERLVALYPAHQVAGCSARVAVGEVEHGKLLFAVTAYFHCDFV